MKKILIIAIYWGTRIPGLVKYLPEFGWQPIILTAPLDKKPDPQFRVIQTYGYNPREHIGVRVEKRFDLTSQKSYRHIRPFLSFLYYKLYQGIVSYPDSYKHWRKFAIKAGTELLQNENIDAIISSSSPVTGHIIAKELKSKFNIPWVADLRDLWSQNHYYQYGPLRKFLDKRLELRTLSTADALVTVSQPVAEKLMELHKGKLVYAITNGFDPAEVNEPSANLTNKFTITYTGRIYPGGQNPTKLFAALRDLISDGAINPEEIEVRFYGPEYVELADEIEKYRLSAIVKYRGIAPRETALNKQKESQLLLLLKWEDPQERGAYTGKIFEYLAARRPILATGGSNDVVTGLLNETKAGIDAPTIPDIKDALEKLYHEYRLKGKIVYDGRKPEIDKYSHHEMARKFSEVLNLFSTQ